MHLQADVIANLKNSIMFLRKTRVAYFDPFSLQIHLDNVESHQISTLMKDGFTPGSINFFKTMNHEDRHYLDTIGTLWGLNYLSILYDIYDELANGNMKIHSKIETLNNQELLWDYEDLVEISKEHWNQDDYWKFEFSIKNSGNKKYLNIRCTDDSGRLICSLPITVDSLLEVNAIYEEVMVSHHLSKSLEPDVRLVEDIIMQKNYIDELVSNPEFIKYGLCAQILLTYLKLENLISPFLYGSLISTLSLNLSKDQIINLPTPKILSHIPCDQLEESININGVGFIKLLGNYLDKNSNDKKVNIDKLLGANNLSGYDSYKTELLNKIDRMKEIIKEPNVYWIFYHQHIENAKVITEKRNLHGLSMPIIQLFSENNHIRPDYILGDDFFDIDPNTLLEMDMLKFTKKEWYTMIDIYKRVILNKENWL